MATNTAETRATAKVTNAATATASARAGLKPEAVNRPLWQVPIFLLGVGVLAAVWTGRPLAVDRTGRQIDRELAAARQLLSRPDGDAKTAAKHARRALELAVSAPDRLAEVHFLLGSAEVRLADHAATLEATDFWKSARQHLEEAERLGVAEQDRGRLQYRLAKTMFYTSEDPQLVADRLASSVDMADDRAEGYRLETEAWLRLPEPNLKKATEANERLRRVYPISPEVQAMAQLQAGELLLRQGQTEAARKVLEKISSQAPAGVLAQKRVMSARSFEGENRWQEAADQWQALLSETREPLTERGSALYHLGVCLTHIGKTEDAAPNWEECLKIGKGEESVAAALALAEVWLQGPTPEKALEPLTRAVAGIGTAADWKNTIVDLKTARERFELGVQKYRERLKYDLALPCLDLYQRLALPARTALLRGDVNAEWARSRQTAAAKMPPGEARGIEEEAARKLFRAAADSYLMAANEVPSEVGEDAVWFATVCRLEAKDNRAAIEALNRYLQVGKNPERIGEAWYRLGECHRKEKTLAATKAAESAYLSCIQHQSTAGYRYTFAGRARYRLALAMVARGDLDNAEAELVRNLSKLRDEPDAEMREKSLFALGGLAFERKDYRKVHSWLGEAIKLDSPLTTPEATRARFQLAESCRQLADEEQRKLSDNSPKTAEEIEHVKGQHLLWLRRAANEFYELASFLDSPEGAGQLKPEERIQVPFLVAICRFDLGEYDLALDIYDHLVGYFAVALKPSPENPAALAAQYPQRRIEALAGVIRCLAALDRKKEARARLEELRGALPLVDETIRVEYEKWVAQISKSLEMP